ncbi:MAG: N-acetyl-gamma-glutamyl-phosphate reductase [Myxococcota bacterium]|nr:N-acetyl-gamma-glutamyl-phosphate reductase [Myxococcota bacterium]
MAKSIYIDGHAGTTGLRIREWLAGRPDLHILTLPESERKSPEARKSSIRDADLAILCLPDAAAQQAAEWAAEAETRVLDASTAHRVHKDWTYGLPELCPGQREQIASAAQVSNPGCWPSIFLLLTRPLIDAGLLPSSANLALHGISGYTGGGREMIERWEDPETGLSNLPFAAPYALDRVHKHIPEMLQYSGLQSAPQFVPAVGPFRCGMRVQMPLPQGTLGPGQSAEDLHAVLTERYAKETFITVHPPEEPPPGEERALDPRCCNDTNRMELWCRSHPGGHVLLVGILDNLGKGAAGAAIQNLNLMLGLPEDEGLPH